MTSPKSEFRLFDRGFEETILLIPGWATDYRVFEELDLGFNYLAPIKFSPFNFKRGLIAALHAHGIERISILGWSMGAFLASDFAGAHPNRVDDGIFIVSAKERYEKDALEETRVHLKKNRKGYLYKFFNDCFCGSEREAFLRFKNGLLKSYIAENDDETLFEGLDYLSDARIKPGGLERKNVTFIHGREDRIAPMREALKLKEGLPQAEFISLDGTGHIPFFNPSFSGLVKMREAR